MARPVLGFNTYMQFARDATWSTFPTITKRFPLYSANARALAGRPRPAILDGTLNQPALVKGMEACELDISMPVCYTGQLILWDLIMWTSTYGSSGGSTSGSDPYTHTWSAFKELMNSGSFEIIYGYAGGAKCIRCTGMKVQTTTLKCSAGIDIADQVMRMDLKLIGYAYTENQTLTGSLVSPSLDFVLQRHMTVQTDITQAATTESALDWELTIDTMVKERTLMEGGGYISEPQRLGRPNFTLTMTREFQARTALTAFLANSAGAIQTIFYLSAGRQLQFDAYGVMQAFPETPVEDEGPIKQKITLVGSADPNGVTTMFGVTVVNSQATITT
jgi:hypothetical protein